MAGAKGGWKLCEHCRSEMSLFAEICPHCGRRAYGGIFGAALHNRRMAEAQNPGGRDREKARKRDRDRTHAYCVKCSRRIYGGEYACEAGHRVAPDWEAQFKAKFGVLPERRPSGPDPALVTLAPRNPTTRSGPHDAWFNTLVVELATLGLYERERNTGVHLYGTPLEGDLVLDGDGITAIINIFATDDLAHQAKTGLLAQPNVRANAENGVIVVRPVARLLYYASGRGSVVDESLLDDIVQLVANAGTPATLTSADSKPEADRKTTAPTEGAGDIMDRFAGSESCATKASSPTTSSRPRRPNCSPASEPSWPRRTSDASARPRGFIIRAVA